MMPHPEAGRRRCRKLAEYDPGSSRDVAS